MSIPELDLAGDNFFTRGNFEQTEASVAFFSEANFENLQRQIRFRVYEQTKFVIDQQDKKKLALLMRGVYFQFAKNLDQPTKEEIYDEIAALNKIVVAQAIPQIIKAVIAHKQYLRDISKPYTLMDRPKAESVKGTKLV